MRSWHPIPPLCLDRKRLLGEHVEVHAIWNVIVAGKTGYRHHPEVKRWRDHLPALAARHDALVAEMARRGYKHESPIAITCSQIVSWPEPIEPIETMRSKLALKLDLATRAASRFHASSPDQKVGRFRLLGANWESRHDRWIVTENGKPIGYVTRYSARQWAARGPSARHQEEVRHTRREALELLSDAYAS